LAFFFNNSTFILFVASTAYRLNIWPKETSDGLHGGLGKIFFIETRQMFVLFCLIDEKGSVTVKRGKPQRVTWTFRGAKAGRYVCEIIIICLFVMRLNFVIIVTMFQSMHILQTTKL
jgi:hypothetical protein